MPHTVLNPSLPFWTYLSHGVHPGTRIEITGNIPHHADRFEINFVLGHSAGPSARENASIALHFNPRIEENAVVLNSRQGSNWEYEQRHDNFYQFVKGGQFQAVFVIDDNGFHLTVNGQFLGMFPHRKPFREIGFLWIEGPVDIHRVDVRGA
jgi:Galactoside-binding lectin